MSKHCYGAKKDCPRYIQQARDNAKEKDWELMYIPSRPPYPSRSISDLSDHYNITTYDKDGINSCTANALCAAYKMNLKKQNFPEFDPSRLFLYYNARDYRRATNKDDGAFLSCSVMAFNCLGVCDETDWTYEQANVKSRPPKSCS